MTAGGAPPRGCLAQILGMLAAMVGVGVIAVLVMVPTLGWRQAVPAPALWSGGALHLMTDSRDLQTCVVRPAGGPPARIVVPYASHEFWATVVVEPAPGITTALACTDQVVATSGPLPQFYPLAKYEMWVFIPAALLAAVGVVVGKPFAAIGPHPTRRKRP